MSTTPVERAGRLGKFLAGAGPGDSSLDWLLVTSLVNIEYLTGFTGTNAACLVSAERRVFLTDFRYAERAAGIEGWEVEIVAGQWLTGLGARLSGRVGFEDSVVTVRELAELEEAAGNAELVPAGRLVERLRRVKDREEVARIAAAAGMTDELYGLLIHRGLAGQTEIELGRWLTAWMREQGAEPSFPPIVASGPNGASPHAEPGPREILPGDLVTVDMGVRLDGYCSDCTRTLAVGDESLLDPIAREIYEVTLKAQSAALESVRAGAEAALVDAAARKVIEAAGYGENFGHGTGHGVGLEIHEAPRLGPSASDVLEAGDVVTIEPGIYLTGKAGVRIEDLVVVGSTGIRTNLSSISPELIFV